MAAFTPLVQSWPKNDTFYPLQILGDAASAVVHFVDTPGLFGAELRILSAVDFRNGKVTRQVDYWDGRRNPIINGRPPVTEYPHGLGLNGTGVDNADAVMDQAARQLNIVLAAGDLGTAMALFTNDAVFDDMTLRMRQEGRLAIDRYLQRAVSHLPYGTGTTLRHVLGIAQGGGYEWQTNGRVVLNGIAALELDDRGAITRMTVVWDASRMDDSAMDALNGLSIGD